MRAWPIISARTRSVFVVAMQELRGLPVEHTMSMSACNWLPHQCARVLCSASSDGCFRRYRLHSYGFDDQIGNLTYFEEEYSSQRNMVRIFKVKDVDPVSKAFVKEKWADYPTGEW